MGNCMGAGRRPRAEEMKTLTEVPSDTHNLNREELPTLRFIFLLEDIRVKKCEQVIVRLFRKSFR
jgi:hypothetical protein